MFLIFLKNISNFLKENNIKRRQSFEIKLECYVCKQIITKANYIRWNHGKNCIFSIINNEIENTIIDLYVNKKYSVMEIEKYFKDKKIGIIDLHINFILEKNKIEKRNYSEIALLRKRNPTYKDISRKEQNWIIQLYQKGKCPREITEITGIKKILAVLKENNIHIRNQKEAYEYTNNKGTKGKHWKWKKIFEGVLI